MKRPQLRHAPPQSPMPRPLTPARLRPLAAALSAMLACGAAAADEKRIAPHPPAVTVYNQLFGVVRETITLDLTSGVNEIRFSDTTAHLEPSSVILRDPTGKRRLRILEQNFRNDPVSQELLLSLYEGKTIDFLMPAPDGRPQSRKGRIVRSGYNFHQNAWQRYGQDYYAAQMAYAGGSTAGVPIIEMDGQLRFGLPGTPLFPDLTDAGILKPTLHWRLESDAAGPLDAELAYVTGGMTWEADYNIVATAQADALDLIGWVTIDNNSGRTFENAKIKLMAGDVSKLDPSANPRGLGGRMRFAMNESSGFQPVVSEKSFDEYHLYTLNNSATLRDRETKQVEFVRADGIESQRIYVYDGLKLDWQQYQGWNRESIRNDSGYGTVSNPKVWVMREFKNTRENRLGIPLPAGRVRFYQKDSDGLLEFTGENRIDHTPQDELVRVYTGNAFDIVGERRRTNFSIDHAARWVDETFEITLRNHKKEATDIRVVEHLYRWSNWQIKEKSHDFRKLDSERIEFPLRVPANGEVTLTYFVHYSW